MCVFTAFVLHPPAAVGVLLLSCTSILLLLRRCRLSSYVRCSVFIISFCLRRGGGRLTDDNSPCFRLLFFKWNLKNVSAFCAAW